MNTNHNSTIRASWHNDWSAARSHTRIMAFESPTFSAAIHALEVRDSRMVRLMSKPIPKNPDAYWIVNARCAQYALTAMRRQQA